MTEIASGKHAQGGMTYADSGVDYSLMDPFKLQAQQAGLRTKDNIRRIYGGRFAEVTESRGESAFLIKTPFGWVAHVEEGLGTKNLVADAMYLLTGKSYYDQIAQCTIAMIVNDLATVGALPLSVAMHLAVGDSDWFKDTMRVKDLLRGWELGCNFARCISGCGETPTLKGIVVPDAVVLSGSAVGIITDEAHRISNKIKAGNAIVIVESSGIHANGLSMARKIAEKLPDGYLSVLPDGRTYYGEALLDPTHIYVGLVEDCINAGVFIRYAVHITGHGWRKFMRANGDFTYVIDTLPTQRPIFDFIQEYGPVDDREAYGNFNMGAGFALYVDERDTATVITVAEKLGLRAYVAGHIEAGEKKVVIDPKGIEYGADTLVVR